MRILGDVIKETLRCFRQRTGRLLQLYCCLCRLTTWQSFHVLESICVERMEVTGQDGAVYLCCLLIYYHVALSHMARSRLIKIRDHISPESLGWKAKYILCSIYIRVFKIIMAINLLEIPKHRNGLLQSRNHCLRFVFFASSPQLSQTSFQ